MFLKIVSIGLQIKLHVKIREQRLKVMPILHKKLISFQNLIHQPQILFMEMMVYFIFTHLAQQVYQKLLFSNIVAGRWHMAPMGTF
ncbi:hypothetical protein D3C80_1581200 [compost metagenome]